LIKPDPVIEIKIGQLDQKIEKKVSNHVFYWVTPISITLLVSVFGYAFYKIDKLDDKLNVTNDRLAQVQAMSEIRNPHKK